MSADLTTKYLGLNLKNPLVVAACPLTLQIESLKQLEQAGAGAARPPAPSGTVRRTTWRRAPRG